jgi:anti-anti-sigma factor
MNLKINTRKIKGVPVLEMKGEITKENLSKIASKLENIKRKNVRAVIFDMSSTNFIDSHGLGVFVHFWHEMAEQKKELIFFRPLGFVKQLLAETSLSRIFRIVDSEEEI